MKKMSSIIQVLIVAILFLSSCKNQVCKSKQVGVIPLTERADNFIIYKDGHVVTFVNQENIELTESVEQRISDNRINVKVNGEGSDALYGTDYLCYDYYERKTKINHFQFSNNDFYIQVKVLNVSDNIDEIKEKVSFVLTHRGGNQRAVEGHYFYETEEFTDPTDGVSLMSEMNEVELNSKIFTDVLVAETENSTIYFKENKGVIGFSVDGDVWVLK